MNPRDIDPRSALIALCAATIQVIGGQAYEADPASLLADDGLAPAGQELVAEGRRAIGLISELASFFGCSIQPPEARLIPENPALPAAVRYILLRIIEQP